MSSNNDSTIGIIELYPQELELLKALRYRWRFGDVVIKVKDGLPYRLVRTQEFIELNSKAEFNTEPIREEPLKVKRVDK
jgi:hypothetical protein